MGGHQPCFEDKFKYKVLDIADLPSIDVMCHFSSTNAWIRNAINSGGKVLVHW